MIETEKIKYYDRLLVVFGVCIAISLIMASFFILINYDGILIVFSPIVILIAFVFLIVFSWGIMYNKYKNKKFIWIAVDVALLFIISFGVWISCIIFYFVYLRRKWKKA